MAHSGMERVEGVYGLEHLQVNSKLCGGRTFKDEEKRRQRGICQKNRSLITSSKTWGVRGRRRSEQQLLIKTQGCLGNHQGRVEREKINQKPTLAREGNAAEEKTNRRAAKKGSAVWEERKEKTTTGVCQSGWCAQGGQALEKKAKGTGCTRRTSFSSDRRKQRGTWVWLRKNEVSISLDRSGSTKAKVKETTRIF